MFDFVDDRPKTGPTESFTADLTSLKAGSHSGDTKFPMLGGDLPAAEYSGLNFGRGMKWIPSLRSLMFLKSLASTIS